MEAKQYSAAVAAIKEKGILSGKRIERSERGEPGEFDWMERASGPSQVSGLIGLRRAQVGRSRTARHIRRVLSASKRVVMARRTQDVPARPAERSWRSMVMAISRLPMIQCTGRRCSTHSNAAPTGTVRA
jgi:hypothetical protein